MTLAGAFPRDTIHVGPTGGWYAVRDLGEERAVAVRPVPGTTEDPFVALRALRATQRGTEMAEGCEVRPARGMYSCCALPVQVCGTCDAPTPCDCTDAMVAAAAMLRRGRLVVGGKVLVPSKYIDKGLVHSTQNGAGTE